MGARTVAHLRQLRRLPLTLLVFALLAGACGTGEDTATTTTPAPTTTAPPPTATATTVPAPTLPPRLSILALGDSFTSGEGVAEPDRWPDQLAARLRDRGVDVVVDYVAGTSWNSSRIWRELARARVADTYDLVTVQAGVNDQFLGFGLESYRTGLDRLFGRAVALTGGDASRVIALSIADWTGTPEGRNLADPDSAEDIAAHCELLQEEAAQRSIVLADITPLSRLSATDASLVAADGLHFSGRLYARWVDEVILPLALEAVTG